MSYKIKKKFSLANISSLRWSILDICLDFIDLHRMIMVLYMLKIAVCIKGDNSNQNLGKIFFTLYWIFIQIYGFFQSQIGI